MHSVVLEAALSGRALSDACDQREISYHLLAESDVYTQVPHAPRKVHIWASERNILDAQYFDGLKRGTEARYLIQMFAVERNTH